PDRARRNDDRRHRGHRPADRPVQPDRPPGARRPVRLLVGRRAAGSPARRPALRRSGPPGDRSRLSNRDGLAPPPPPPLPRPSRPRAGASPRLGGFGGSSPGPRPTYADAPRRLARLLVARGIGLVYGGGGIGLMGVLADTVLEQGGEVIGIIPRALARREIAHRGLTELRVVATMHERKAAMAEVAEAFVALPGGLGTFEELFEIATWAQLGLHAKPVGVLNVDGYFDPLIALVARAVEERFVRPEHAEMVVSASEPEALLSALSAWRAPAPVTKWLDPSEI